LKYKKVLDPQDFDGQWKAQRELRKLYDGFHGGQQAFAQQFGTVSEKLESFDEKFRPNEGWKIFYSNFSGGAQ